MSPEIPTPEESDEYRPYEDPELIASSGGSRELLNRLVAWKLALIDVNRSTGEDKERAMEYFSVMSDEVSRYRAELGLPPEDTPGAPE